MAGALDRLLRPRSIAVIGGGAWCDEVIRQAKRMAYQGEIWPVHPRAAEVAGRPAFASLADLPNAPDAAFVGVNRNATIEIVGELAAMGAGGAVCFASGFSEAAAEDVGGRDLQAQLMRAAGKMPFLGPNCYGFINALDRSVLWPDQHGCRPIERGIAILTQSSNISINLTMQKRGLPVGFMAACGNMAQVSQAALAAELVEDPRITGLGLHIEGFGDLREWEALAARAHARDVPIVALKVGVSDQAQAAMVSHTASLTGGADGAAAFLDRLGIRRVATLPELLETLKLLHCYGPLPGHRIASISCSGGEASLIADLALGRNLTFPDLTEAQRAGLRAALGPMVALANPLDYHTYIWRDAEAMARVWAQMTGSGIAMTLSVVDYPTTDATDWTCATEAAIRVRAETGAPFGVVASLPELMPLDVAQRLMAHGVVPFLGLSEALAAVEAAAGPRPPAGVPVCLAGSVPPGDVLSEAAAKAALATHRLAVPRSVVAAVTEDMAAVLAGLEGPFAVKGLGVAHKTEQGAVRLGIQAGEVAAVAEEIGAGDVLVEEMIMDGVAEMLIGVTHDPAGYFVLTLGAGGVLAEILRDTAALILPVPPEEIRGALDRLAIAPMLDGYRGRQGADKDAIVAAVLAVQSYVVENAADVSEVEVNPLICTPDQAVAVDALIRKA